MNRFIERAIQSIDIEAVTKDVMSTLVITELDMFFVVGTSVDCPKGKFVGMTYSLDAAKRLAKTHIKGHAWTDPDVQCKVIRFDMSKLATLVEDMGAAEQVYVTTGRN